MDLRGQVAIITGGSQGIGQAVAKLLGGAGAAVLINYVGDDEQAEETIRSIKSSGGRAVGFNGDISVRKNVENMYQYCTETLGKPDILVANAGVGIPPKPLVEITEEDYRFIYDINVKGTIFCIIEAAKQLNDGGRIVVTSSSTVVNPVEGIGIYTSSKAALEAFVRETAPELARRGISINSVRPGLTVTPMSMGDLSQDYMNMVKEDTAFKRLGEPDDIASIISFLCEKRSQWVTGQSITANGGSKF